jgi:hypothetical protein
MDEREIIMRTSIGCMNGGWFKETEPCFEVNVLSKIGNFIRITEKEDGSIVIKAIEAKFSIGRDSEFIIETRKVNPDTNLSGD